MRSWLLSQMSFKSPNTHRKCDAIEKVTAKFKKTENLHFEQTMNKNCSIICEKS